MDQRCARYPTDLDDACWELIRRLIPPGKPVGAERVTSMRDVVNAVLYRRRAGCSWRMLPHDFPHWRTVYGYYRQWQREGTWRAIESALRCSMHAAAPAEVHHACQATATFASFCGGAAP